MEQYNVKKTRDNHYVPQWHQKGFMDERNNQLSHLTRQEKILPNGNLKIINSKKWYTSSQRFYTFDLYSTFFGSEVNDEIEKKLFGPIDDNGSKSVRAFLTDDKSQWHYHFEDFFTYIDAQKLRTPKGLDWIKSKYPKLTQSQLMAEMQSLRTMHCTLWAEGVRELVSAEESSVKFILSDHPVTVYNYAFPPDSEACSYPNDPDITLNGTQTIFPLDKNRCLILTNLEYAKDPDNINPKKQRTNATRIRQSMVNTINFINSRKLTDEEVNKINYIIKSRAKDSIAGGRGEWLYPDEDLNCDWASLRHLLLPSSKEISKFGGEIVAKFDDGTVHYQDAYGRTHEASKFLDKETVEKDLGRNDLCGCGSGRKYKNCCNSIPEDLRTTWKVASIRERNLAFCDCIQSVFGLTKGKTWNDVRRELSQHHIKEIYSFYAVLWPRETDIYSLLPKSDARFRGLYSGLLDSRTIALNALPFASFFDEYLIQSPLINPNNVKPDFNPIINPDNFMYQALKDFLFILQLQPFIALGTINLIPDPSEFDLELKRAMLNMADKKGRFDNIMCKNDFNTYLNLTIEDLLNSTAMLSRDLRIKLLINELNLTEIEAKETINSHEKNIESLPLALLQKSSVESGGQFMFSCIAPNYEMSLLMAQITGSVLVTDSGSRWKQFMSAQHRDLGLITYPCRKVSEKINKIPIDHEFINGHSKSQGDFATARHLLKNADRILLDNNFEESNLRLLADQALSFSNHLNLIEDKMPLKRLKIVSPRGGFYDSNVQRLLARSSCLAYDQHVRSVYGLNIPEQE